MSCSSDNWSVNGASYKTILQKKKKEFMRKRHPSQITNVVMSKKCNYNNYDL